MLNTTQPLLFEGSLNRDKDGEEIDRGAPSENFCLALRNFYLALRKELTLLNFCLALRKELTYPDVCAEDH